MELSAFYGQALSDAKPVKSGYTHLRQTQVCDQIQYSHRYPTESYLKSAQIPDVAHCE